jgi:hypothetical protein
MSEPTNHTSEEAATSREIRAGMIAVYMVIAIAGIYVMLFVMENLFTLVSSEEIYAKQASVPSSDLEKLRTSEHETLTTYKVLDKEKGIYQIPVSDAMSLVVRDYASRASAAPAPSTGAAPEGSVEAASAASSSGGTSQEVAPPPEGHAP